MLCVPDVKCRLETFVTVIELLTKDLVEATVVYCERDKGVPKGRLYNWEDTTAIGRQNLETRWAESLLVVCLCVSSLSLIDAQKTVAVPIRG